jgi:hypothetical protein
MEVCNLGLVKYGGWDTFMTENGRQGTSISCVDPPTHASNNNVWMPGFVVIRDGARLLNASASTARAVRREIKLQLHQASLLTSSRKLEKCSSANWWILNFTDFGRLNYVNFCYKNAPQSE